LKVKPSSVNLGNRLRTLLAILTLQPLLYSEKKYIRTHWTAGWVALEVGTETRGNIFGPTGNLNPADQLLACYCLLINRS
jgi:hypothetical protein